jgi:hypothetical protein
MVWDAPREWDGLTTRRKSGSGGCREDVGNWKAESLCGVEGRID